MHARNEVLPIKEESRDVVRLKIFLLLYYRKEQAERRANLPSALYFFLTQAPVGLDLRIGLGRYEASR
jgi:hypothetical protein